MAKRAEQRWDKMDKLSMPLEKLIIQFEALNRAEGKTESTVEWYNLGLGQFMDWLHGKGEKPVLAMVNPELVREYIVHLQRRAKFEVHPTNPRQEKLLSPTTVVCYVRTLKTFTRWLHREGYTPEDLLARVKQPKAPRRLIEPLSDAEVALILARMDPQISSGARNMAVVLLLLDSGLRFTEALTLEMKNLHLEDNYAKVFGKGQKERVVPFGGSAQKSLMRYVYHFRPEPMNTDQVFLNLDGRPMTDSSLKVMFRRLADSSGVNRLHPHLLRHTFAVNFLRAGGDVFALQEIMGHTTLEMTRKYVHLANVDVLRQHRQFSPVDRMNLRQMNRNVLAKKRTRHAGAGSRFAAS